jgi:hypothetical protein
MVEGPVVSVFRLRCLRITQVEDHWCSQMLVKHLADTVDSRPWSNTWLTDIVDSRPQEHCHMLGSPQTVNCASEFQCSIIAADTLSETSLHRAVVIIKSIVDNTPSIS